MRVSIGGSDISIASDRVTAFALLLHELATNAAKYGALSTPAGSVEIACVDNGEEFILTWTERGGPPVDYRGDSEGFGSRLTRATVEGQLGGSILRDWRPEGLVIRLSVARAQLAG